MALSFILIDTCQVKWVELMRSLGVHSPFCQKLKNIYIYHLWNLAKYNAPKENEVRILPIENTNVPKKKNSKTFPQHHLNNIQFAHSVKKKWYVPLKRRRRRGRGGGGQTLKLTGIKRGFHFGNSRDVTESPKEGWQGKDLNRCFWGVFNAIHF